MNTAEYSIQETLLETRVANARVLVIDDDRDIHALVTSMLKPLQAAIATADDGVTGIAAALDDLPDVILLDQEMPGMSGLEVLTAMQSHAELAGIPVIVVTGSESRSVLTAFFAAGASDYIRKPFLKEELRARVSSVIDRQRMLVQLRHLAHIDPLTGLPNRSLLHHRLQFAIDRAVKDASYGFALMFIDFDRFKFVNDSLGHEIGDLLLAEIASRLRMNLRASDSVLRDAVGTTVARLGGDEFVVILDGIASAEAAGLAADRLLCVLEQPYQLRSHSVRSSASIGIVHSSAVYTSADDMLRDADIAMYEAKSRGRACHAQFTSVMRDVVRRRLATENALRDAMGTEQLFLVYQPVVSLRDRRLEGVEVLLRWRHPQLGLISPAEFIPIAEETRIILPLADQMLRRACEQFALWQQQAPGQAPDYLSVNLFREQLSDSGIVNRTLQILRETGVRPAQLQLEVTESQIMQHRVMAGELLAAFKAEGIRLAIDDFGTGHSSLSCLQEYPFDVLKIDKALTSNVSRAGGYAALLNAIVALADNIGLHTVVEGIESLDQLVLLQALGCPAGQGQFLAKPMEAAELALWWDELPKLYQRVA